MDKVAQFYARRFAKKRPPEYSAAEVGPEDLVNDLLGVHESNKRDFWESSAVQFLGGTIPFEFPSAFAGTRSNDRLRSNRVP